MRNRPLHVPNSSCLPEAQSDRDRPLAELYCCRPETCSPPGPDDLPRRAFDRRHRSRPRWPLRGSLFDDAATKHPDSVNSIEGFRINNDLDSIEADIRTLDACDYVWETTIEDLKFDPIEIDRRSLLIIPESTPFAPGLERFERDAAKTDQ